MDDIVFGTEKAEMEFLRTELLAGLTFSRIARDSRDATKRGRNQANARKAYDSLVRYMPRVNLLKGDWQDFQSKLEQLKSELHALGEEI